MEKLEITLKQYTPIIHFQSFEDGATLRATEVKPKLDRFLIAKYKLTQKSVEGIRAKNEYINWFNNSEKLSLDYKLRIIPRAENKLYLPLAYIGRKKRDILTEYLNKKVSASIEILSPTPYFANMGILDFDRFGNITDESKPEELKYALHSRQNIKMVVSSFNTALIRGIGESIAEFFLRENFGARQNKGFGSFLVSEINNEPLSYPHHNFKNLYLAKHQFQNNDVHGIFNFITKQYDSLKRGLMGKKSRLFDYFYRKDIIWEKDLFMALSGYNNRNRETKRNARFVRALLGLTEVFEFSKNRPSFEVVLNNPEIERYKSPVFFKVIHNTVYIRINETPDEILNKSFNYELKIKGNANPIKDSISTPDQFNARDFLMFALRNNRNWQLLK